MALTATELKDLKDLVDSDQWQVYLGWLDLQMENTFREMMTFETDQDQFIRLHARLRTLMDCSYFLEKELWSKPDSKDEDKIKETRSRFIRVDKEYSSRFLAIFRTIFGRPE